MGNCLLSVENLKTYFYTSEGVVPAVDDVSFHVNEGETLGIVGESGCGKSVTALSILQLIPMPPGKIESGRIIFDGENLLHKSKRQIRNVRGCSISMVFQEVMTSLNPVMKVGRQISEAIELHQNISAHEARKKTIEYLRIVGIANPEKRVNEYPYQLSGGMRQRIMIAIAIVCNPKLIIADEPTTALDVTIQAQVLDLMLDLKSKLGTAILLITHDLGLIAETAERIIVMYAGKIVEEADVNDLFEDPQHPYTRGLLTSIPRIDTEKKQLSVIKGVVPRPTNFPEGCRFHPRCDYVQDICKQRIPVLRRLERERRVACWINTDEYKRG